MRWLLVVTPMVTDEEVNRIMYNVIIVVAVTILDNKHNFASFEIHIIIWYYVLRYIIPTNNKDGIEIILLIPQYTSIL